MGIEIVLLVIIIGSALGLYVISKQENDSFPKIETEEQLETITRTRQAGGA